MAAEDTMSVAAESTTNATTRSEAAAAGALATTTPYGAGTLLAAMGGPGAGGIVVPKPFAEPILLVEGAHIAGTTHVRGIREVAAELGEGERLILERDPANRHDRWCIRVLDGRGRRLGFVPADVNEIPARLMDGGKALYALATGVEQRGTWTRIGMEVYLDD